MFFKHNQQHSAQQKSIISNYSVSAILGLVLDVVPVTLDVWPKIGLDLETGNLSKPSSTVESGDTNTTCWTRQRRCFVHGICCFILFAARNNYNIYSEDNNFNMAMIMIHRIDCAGQSHTIVHLSGLLVLLLCLLLIKSFQSE